MAAALTATIAVVWLLVPGWVMLRLARVRGLLALAAAPACSMAALAVGAIVTDLLGMEWGWLAALASSALGIAVAAVIGVLTGTGPRYEPLTVAKLVTIALGVLVAVAGVALGAGSADAYLQRYDAVFHLAALTQIDQTGSASSLTLGSLSYGDGRAAAYPAGWHALASLLPGSTTSALVIGSSVTATIAWVSGCALLTVELARWARRSVTLAAAAGALLAGVVTATPMSLWAGWGHTPNAAALAMVPAAVGVGLHLVRDHIGRACMAVVLVVMLGGIALTHPNAAIAAIVLLLPALASVLARRARRRWADGSRLRAIVEPVLVVAVGAGAAIAVLVSPLAGAVVGYAGHGTQSLPSAVLETVVGAYTLWTSLPGVVAGLLAIAGSVLAVRRRRWVPLVMLLITWVLYLDAAVGGPLGVSSLWYTSTARLAVVVTIVVVPLAAIAATAAVNHLRPQLPAPVVLGPAVVLVLALAVTSIAGSRSRAVAVFDADPGHPPQLVTAGEREMIASLPGLVDGTILGNPYSGAASVYGLTGLPVVFPVPGQVWSPDQQLIMDHLPEIGSGQVPADVCAALDRLDVRYLYTDSVPYVEDPQYAMLDLIRPPGHEVAAGDTAAVIELEVC